MATAAVFDGDEVWDFNTSSEEEDIDSDILFGEDDEEEPSTPKVLASRSPAEAPATASSTAENMAALIGRLRCDNLELRKALAEAEREIEAAAMAYKKEKDERRRLQAVLEQAAQERAAESKIAEESPMPAEAANSQSKTEGSQAPVQAEGDERSSLERQLVSSKIKEAAACERAEGLEALVEYYEGQLKTLNPNFRPTDLSTLGRRGDATPCSEPARALTLSEMDGSSPVASASLPLQSPTGKEKHHRSSKHRIKKWAGKLLHRQGSGHNGSGSGAGVEVEAGEVKPPTACEDIARQREVISCLMGELEKANHKIQRYKSKSSKKKGSGAEAAEANLAAGN